MLYITDRSDRALSHMDEIRFWLGETVPYHFPAPSPLFYEQAQWGARDRRSRLQCFSYLAQYFAPIKPKGLQPPLMIAPLRCSRMIAAAARVPFQLPFT